MNNVSKNIYVRLNEDYFDGDEITVSEDEFEESDYVGTAKSNSGIYFGDPCYVLGDEVYDKIWGEKYEYSDGVIEVDNNLCFVVHRTAYGDGEFYGYDYPNQYAYPVDSGCLAIIPTELIDPDKEKDADRLGHIFRGSKEAIMNWKNGVFKIDFDNVDSTMVDTNI